MNTARRRPHPVLAALAAFGLAVPPALAQPDVAAWGAVATPHFEILTDAALERGAEIAVSLELFRSVFARLAPALELASPAPTTIIAFRDESSYAPYKSRADAADSRILGQFLSHPDGNYLTLDAGTRLVGSFAVIYHEYVHYFVRHNFPGVPLWLNEGLAEYYSTFAVEDGVVHVGRPVDRHVRFLERDPDFSLYRLLEVTRESSDYHEGDKAGRFYAVSWALVHFLLSGGDARADQIADFLLALQAGGDAGEAFEEAFDTRLGRLEEELRACVAAGDFPQASFKVSDLGAQMETRSFPERGADTLFHLGDLLVHMGRREEAERHFRRALDLDPRHPEALAGLALLRDLDGRYGEAEVLYRDAVARSRDPLVPLLYGRHLLQRVQAGDGEASELAPAARAALASAIDLDADFAEAHALYGLAHLLDDADPAPGIVALTKAHAWLPERHDVTFHLLQLYLKDEDFAGAERVLAKEIAGRAEPEQALAAREEIDRARLLYQASAALEEGDAERAVELYDEAISVTSDPEMREQMEGRLRGLQERLGLR